MLIYWIILGEWGKVSSDMLGIGIWRHKKQSGVTVAGSVPLAYDFSSYRCRFVGDSCQKKTQINRRRNWLLLADKIRYRDTDHFIKLRLILRYIRCPGLGNITYMVDEP